MARTGSPRRAASAALLLASLLLPALTLVASVRTAASAEPSAQAAAEAPTKRLLVLALPNLVWDDVDEERLPNIWALLEDAAVANLSLRIERRASPAGDAYATIGAGTRALAADELGGLVLEPDEPYGLGTASEEFARRTGTDFTGAAGLLTLPSITRQNDDAAYGGRVGLVGSLLRRGGFEPAVIANSDRSDSDGPSWHREAALALMDTRGIVHAGVVGRSLLEADPTAPGGARLDNEAVLATFDDVWHDGAVVLVEASDLRRVESQTGTFTSARRATEKERALRATDALVGALLERTDPSSDVVLVVAPSNPGQEPRLTVAALRAPGTEPERLYSGQTRRPGYVTITDVGPTILDLVGIEAPATMEGRPFVPGGGVRPLQERIDGLRSDETDARFRDRLVRPITNALVVAHVLLLVAVAVSTWRGGRRTALLRFVALALLSVLPLTYLAGLFPFADLGALAYVTFLIGGGLCIAGVLTAAWPDRAFPPLAVVLGLVIGVICASVVLLDSDLQFNTVFGDSPIVAGRFGGVNNVTFAQLFAAAILLAALLVQRPGGTRGRSLALGLLVAVLLVDVLPFWGADVGGILAGVPAVALTTALLLELRIRLRTLAIAGVATAAALTLLAMLDLSRPSAQRSHLGRLVERIGDDGADGITLVVQRKIDQNVAALTGTLWMLLVVVAVLVVAYLAVAAPGSRQDLMRRMPSLRAAGWGLLATGALGMALNDSGIAVPGMMLAIAVPVVIVLLTGFGWPIPAEGHQWATWWRSRPAVRARSDEAGVPAAPGVAAPQPVP